MLLMRCVRAFLPFRFDTQSGPVLCVQIPKSPTGKVLRRALQDKYDQRMKKPRTRL
jgi:acyl-CoA synthetase (AMP-forming)/AMP-acid ligase II